LAARLAPGHSERPGRLAHEALSKREFQVFRLLAAGLSGKTVADELGLSEKTVSTYRTRVLTKLHLNNTAEMIRYAVVHELV